MSPRSSGSGAAGGIAGMLAALGGTLLPGFDLVADELDLYDRVADADLVITGEGHLDAQSFNGKVVGGLAEVAAEYGVAVAAIVGIADADVRDRIATWAIADRFGESAGPARTAVVRRTDRGRVARTVRGLSRAPLSRRSSVVTSPAIGGLVTATGVDAAAGASSASVLPALSLPSINSTWAPLSVPSRVGGVSGIGAIVATPPSTVDSEPATVSAAGTVASK